MKQLEMLSPSSINTYEKCPRLFFLKYKAGMKIPNNIHFYKGRLVHEIIEHVFDTKKYRRDMNDWCQKQLTELWSLPPDIRCDDEEKEKLECSLMLRNFCFHFDNKIELALMDKKVNSKDHAWNLLKPRLREYKMLNDELKLHGIIDSVEHNWDDSVYIVDYKTSKLFGSAVGDDYIRQLELYALLYKLDTGVTANFTSINYLRYPS